MDINQLLYARNKMLSKIITPEMESLGKGLSSLKYHDWVDKYDVGLNALLPNMPEFINAIFKKTTIEADSGLFRMLNIRPVSFLEKVMRYEDILRSIDEEFIVSPMVEIDYEMDEEVTSISGETNEEHKILFNETRTLQHIITNIYNDNSQLSNLDPRKFEEVVAELLYKQGFKVELTKQTRDGGYDILAILPMQSHSPQKWLVECKRWSENRKVDVQIIRAFKEVIQTNNANKGLIVTTSYFSLDAQKKVQETPYTLDLRDKDSLIVWIGEYMRKIRP